MGKENIDGVDGNVKKESFQIVKTKANWKKQLKKKSVISYLCFGFSGLSAIER